MFIYDLAIFLTSTAFMDTKAKYGIPLSRYTVFLQNCPLERRSNVAGILFLFRKIKYYLVTLKLQPCVKELTVFGDKALYFGGNTL